MECAQWDLDFGVIKKWLITFSFFLSPKSQGFLKFVEIFVEWGFRVVQHVTPVNKAKVLSQFACCQGERHFFFIFFLLKGERKI